MKKDTRTIVNTNTKENIENNIENEIIDDNITFQVINLHTAEEYKERSRKENNNENKQSYILSSLLLLYI